MATVTIGCRLPSGIVLEVGDKKVTIAGQRQAQKGRDIILLSNDDYGTTEVDQSFWEAFKKNVGEDFAPIASGALFEAKSRQDAGAKAKELKDEKTGLEPVSQKTKDIKPEGEE